MININRNQVIINVILCSTFIPVRICKLRPRTSCSEAFWFKCVGANQVSPIKLLLRFFFALFFFSSSFVSLYLTINTNKSVRMIIVNPAMTLYYEFCMNFCKHVKWIQNKQKKKKNESKWLKHNNNNKKDFLLLITNFVVAFFFLQLLRFFLLINRCITVSWCEWNSTIWYYRKTIVYRKPMWLNFVHIMRCCS